MAFENVFRNIDFQAPVRAQAQQSDKLMQLLGMGMQQRRFDQEMDMKERQLEAKGNEFNLKRSAENALLKQNMGMPLTDQEQAFIQTMSQIAPPSYSTDPYGNVVSRPSGWGALGRTGTFTGQPMTNETNWSGARPSDNRIGNTGYGQGSNPAITQDYADISPEMLAPMSLNDMEAAVGRVDDMPPQIDIPRLPDTPNYDNSPVGEIDAGKAKTDLAKYAAEKNVDLEFLDEKQKRQLAFEMEKADKEAQRAKKLAEPSKLAESGIMIEDIGRSLDILSSGEGFLPKTGTVGSIIDYFPETQAGRLASQLKSVQNLVGFGKLAGMREQSPTGSSGLGALSEQEMEGLKSTSGNLSTKQRKEDLEYNLKRLHNQQMDLVHGTPEHIEKVSQEKNLSPAVVEQLSMRYDLSRSQKRRKFNPQTGMLE